MSCSYAKGAWEVRWRDSAGRQRSRRFGSEDSAREFDSSIHHHDVRERKRTQYGSSGGVYAYKTASGTRWRCLIRRSDGSFTSKRGFVSKKAAVDAWRRMTEQQERGEVRHTKETFGAFWSRWLASRRAYPSRRPGAHPRLHQRQRATCRRRRRLPIGAFRFAHLALEHGWVTTSYRTSYGPARKSNSMTPYRPRRSFSEL